MDAFSSVFESQSRSLTGWSYDSLKNFHQISPVVQTHLEKVFDLLKCTLLLLFHGAYFHLTWNIGGIITTIGCIGSFLWLLFKPKNLRRKKLALFLAVFFEGASIIPVMKLAIEVDPLLLMTVLFGSLLAPTCFSLAAIWARRRAYLYLGAVLSSGVSTSLWLIFVFSSFGGSTVIFKFELFCGFLLYVCYMLVVTRVIIEKAHRGDMDYVQHMLMFFIPNIFVQILRILWKNSPDKRGKKKEKERLRVETNQKQKGKIEVEILLFSSLFFFGSVRTSYTSVVVDISVVVVMIDDVFFSSSRYFSSC